MKRITLIFPWPLSAKETRQIIDFIFQVALLTYLAFFLMESLKAGFVSLYYRLDTFLWVAVITGVLASLWSTTAVHARSKGTPTWKDFMWMMALALSTMAVVWYKTSSIGWLVTIIAPLSGLIVLGLSLLMHYDRDTTTSVE